MGRNSKVRKGIHVTEEEAIAYIKETVHGKLADLVYELDLEYKGQRIIHRFRRDEQSIELKSKNELEEKYAQKLFKLVPSIGLSKARSTIKGTIADNFVGIKIENEIDWSNFEEVGNCANEAIPFLDLVQQRQAYGKCKKKHKFTCSRCKKISYCSKECSVQFWPYHKKICKTLQDIASEVD